LAIKLYSYIIKNGVITKSVALKPIVVTENKDTLFYIINNHNGGWCIISGDSRTPEILAISNSGSFKINELNPGVNYWINELKEYLKNLKKSKQIIEEIENPIWSKIKKKELYTKNQPSGDGFYELIHVKVISQNDNTYGPLISTKWGQTDPWNQCVPFKLDLINRGYVGCIAVATAQLLYYYNSKWNNSLVAPGTGVCNGWINNYSSQFSNFSNSAWLNMSKIIGDYYGSYSSSSIFLGYVAIGTQTTFTNTDAWSTNANLRNFLNNENIGYNYSSYNYNVVISEIINGNPVLITCQQDDFLPIYGHAWIIDGYKINSSTCRFFYKWRLYSEFDENGSDTSDNNCIELDENGYPVEYDLFEDQSICAQYFKMNWGWDGWCDDAFYSIYGNWQPSSSGSVFDPFKHIFFNFTNN
jgi:hypothetical protein